MSDTPSTIHGDPGTAKGVGWDDTAELHRLEDQGVLSRFNAIRRGTLAELVRFVMSLPESMQADYAIEKSGDHRLKIGEIRALARRPDYPRVSG